jgi:hypothetical protein
MRFWLLDDGPFGLLAKNLNPSWNWPASCLHIVKEVALAAQEDRSGRRTSWLGLRQGSRSVIEVHPIMAGTAAAKFLFEYLRPNAPGATKNLGEDASIAFCAKEQSDAVFVTMDKGAAFVALAELGPTRVASPLDLWRELFAEGLIDESQFSNLCDAVVKALGLPGTPARVL